MKSIVLSILAFALAAGPPSLFAGGKAESTDTGTSPATPVIQCFVSIPPQVYFVKEIGGGRVEVHSLVPPGTEPENYDPTPRQIVKLSQARLYFAVGLPFEEVLVSKIRSTMKDLTVVDTQADIPLRSFAQHVTGAADTGTDPHIWLSPQLVKIQGAAIEKALAVADPAGAQAYAAGLKRLDEQMDQLHRQIASTLAGLSGRSFFVFHPAFGYFADEFDLRQVSIEVEGKNPGPKQLAGLISEAKGLKVKMIFVEPQFDRSRAEVIADSVGARVVTIDPLAEDYVKNLEEVAKSIKSAID